MRHVTPRYLSSAARKTATRFPFPSGFDIDLDAIIDHYVGMMPGATLEQIRAAEDVGDVTDILDAFLDTVDLEAEVRA
jgi:hypothetical protein